MVQVDVHHIDVVVVANFVGVVQVDFVDFVVDFDFDFVVDFVVDYVVGFVVLVVRNIVLRIAHTIPDTSYSIVDTLHSQQERRR
jgi:hypothetical protein